MNAAGWRAELDSARAAGLNEIIIQYLTFNGHTYIPAEAGGPDPTEHVLAYADAHGMRVWLGLAHDDRWWHRWSEPASLAGMAEDCERVAEQAWSRYGRHPSLAGWSIPQELSDGAWSDEQIGLLRGYLARVSAACKRLSGNKPVMIAPYFSGTVQPQRIETAWSRLLDGAGVDVLALQDGAGAREWGRTLPVDVLPYYRAWRGACVSAGVDLWADIELFRTVRPTSGPAATQPAGFAPADTERLAVQMAAAAPFVRKMVAFDYFHYMSPRRGARQREFDTQYRTRFVERGWRPTIGRSMIIAPEFSYYKDRSVASIASELRVNGYPIVRYIPPGYTQVDPALVAALRAEGLGVWLDVGGNGVYSTAGLPAEWKNWAMVTRSDLEGKPWKDGYQRLCLNHPGYRAWKKADMARQMKAADFDGADLFEPHWPEYPGPTSPAYACFCDGCKSAFTAMFPGETALPDIMHADAPHSPAKNPRLWHRWLEFRRRTLISFLDDVVNGPGGFREAAPGKKVCIWGLALLGQDGLRRMLEDSGQDAGEIAATVRPDLYCLQTHWPDWLRTDLPSDYVRGYEPFVEQVRARSPATGLMIQAELGSKQEIIRRREWVEGYERASLALGVESTTAYEYFVAGWSYDEPPRVAEVRVIEKADGTSAPRQDRPGETSAPLRDKAGETTTPPETKAGETPAPRQDKRRETPVPGRSPAGQRQAGQALTSRNETGDHVIVELHCTRRLAVSAAEPARYLLSGGAIERVELDGSIVRLHVSGVAPGNLCTLEVKGLSDDPTRRLFHGRPASILGHQIVRFHR